MRWLTALGRILFLDCSSGDVPRARGGRKELFALVGEEDPPDFILVEAVDLKIIITTFTDEGMAVPIVRKLLEEQVIACGTLLPGATSLYSWQGGIEEAPEVMVVLKMDQETVGRCMIRLRELHPYEVPEIIVLSPAAVSRDYSKWVRDALRNRGNRVN